MHWLDKHARFRNQLSPYLDGALSSAERTTLEAHLATCETCRAELDELRSVVASARELPQVEPPRSFALTPQMLDRRVAPATPSVPPLAVGLRFASAGVAVCLAVLVIADLGDAGGPDGSQEAADELGASRSMAEFAAEADVDQADGESAIPAPDTPSSSEGSDAQPPAEGATPAPRVGDDATACPPEAAAVPTEGGSSAAGAGGPSSGGAGGGSGAGGETAVATPTPQPAAPPTAEVIAGTATGCEEQPIAGALAPTTSAPEPEPARDSAAENLSAEGALEAEADGRVSTLRVLEIVLAGALIALFAGIGVELVLRRRREA